MTFNIDVPRTIERFWMVYGIGRSAPAIRHSTKDAARKEAERLAKANPGTNFVVLSATAAYRTSQPLVTEVEIVKRKSDPIPF